MGRVAGSYGVRGWIKVAPGKGVAQTLAAARDWWIGEHAYVVTEAKQHSASLVAKLVGIETREQAMRLKGARVALERAALADPGEGHYYLADLIGLEVRNEQDELLGTVKQWFSNGAQDVMEVVGGRTRLIPWVSAVVKQVDLGARRIVVDWAAEW
ncbi:MAG TPA: ribosome maturation factor RimM [Burkholderiales bacterium]|nr:ribosome maturation factor RimM [Burkholderiales bacterium]